MSNDDHDDGLRLARRALLKASIYVPPAVIGTLLIPRDAEAQTDPSCGPITCDPATCNPTTCTPGLCGPEKCAPGRPPPCTPDLCGPEVCNPNPP